MNKKSQLFIWSAGLICTAAALGIYYLTIGFQGMPPTEGWYTWYAQMINDGAMVYRDFPYLFPPAYIQLIAVFCKYFGYSIFMLRALGLVVFVAIGAVAYLIFSQFARPAVATMAAIATAMFMQSEEVQIFYDYVRFMDLFAYLSLYFLIRIMKKLPKDCGCISLRNRLDAWCMGFFAALACMVKQSTGAIIIAYYIILLLFLVLVLNRSRSRYLLDTLLNFILVVAVVFCVMVFWLVKNDAFDSFLVNTTGYALDAKGGIVTVLFSWISILSPLMLTQVLPALAVIAVFLVASGKIPLHRSGHSAQNRTDARAVKWWEDWGLLFLGAGLTAGLIVMSRICIPVAFPVSDSFPINSRILGFVLCTICFAFLGFYYLYFALSNCKTAKTDWEDSRFLPILPWFALLGTIFAIAYGCGMSATLVEGQTALSMGFLVVFLAKGFESFRFRSAAMVLLVLYGALFSASCGARKYINLYSWWGLTEGTVWEAWDKADAPLLERIKMNSQEAAMYEGVARIIEEYTEEGNEIFCFPHIPVLYSITGRTSGTYTQVQWFDMCNINDINRDIRTLRQDPPKAIVYCSLPETTYIGHEWRFNAGEKSQTRIMSEFLMQMVEEQQYECMGSFPVCEGYTIHVYVDPAPIH